jgi:hypothetical protein
LYQDENYVDNAVSPLDFDFPAEASNYNFTLDLYDTSTNSLLESVSTWIHIGADYLKPNTLKIEPGKD